MFLPGAQRAVIEAAKIRDYLLSSEHPVGRYKAAFFEALGYTRSDWKQLHDDLLDLCLTKDAVEGHSSPFGQKYEVRGRLDGPVGRGADVVTVWVVLVGEDVPRFVTAFPE